MRSLDENLVRKMAVRKMGVRKMGTRKMADWDL
jgi:hypothetical protein